MAARGRKSAASMAIVPPYDPNNMDATGRIQPPAELTPDEAEVFRRTVNGKPAEWFGFEHLGALILYCQTEIRLRELRMQLANLNKKDKDYFKKAKALDGAIDRKTKNHIILARSMRLMQISAFRAKDTPVSRAGSHMAPNVKKPWDV